MRASTRDALLTMWLSVCAFPFGMLGGYLHATVHLSTGIGVMLLCMWQGIVCFHSLSFWPSRNT